MFMLYVPETDTLEIVYREELGPVEETFPDRGSGSQWTWTRTIVSCP